MFSSPDSVVHLAEAQGSVKRMFQRDISVTRLTANAPGKCSKSSGLVNVQRLGLYVRNDSFIFE